MSQLATSLQYLFIPVDGPPGVDLTAFQVDIALIADDGTEPGSGDWQAAQWLAPDSLTAPQAALNTGPGGTAAYPAGMYMAFVRVHASPELPVCKAGRWRVGV